ncbi:response regulator [Nitrospirillum pindoramense]|uniref:Response regulator receiver domain-containing protein n=1 Tax=Nitrospirillum amazonense TaxID=28077 RepID=A0A560H7C5_9PROT|nr:response regulator [Nitrospirillum amazonense]TWB41729.1 response regulator receiver domain-containing protein [Nitrospirillum amazonense]
MSLDLSKIQTLLVDADLNTRRILRAMLARMGMDKVTDHATLAEAAGSPATIDLVILDADQADGAALRWIHAIRHGLTTLNPFVGAIVMTWNPTQQMLIRFASSGADDILVKPYSPKQVQERLVNLVENRKKFVVTSDYIGPDRRRAPREGQVIQLIDVPNPPRLKCTGEFDRVNIHELTAQAARVIDAEKVVRHGFQVAFLVEFALPGLSTQPPEKRAMDHALRVTSVLEDLERRLPPGDLRVEATNHIRRMETLLGILKTRHTLPPHELEQLRQDAHALMGLTSRVDDAEKRMNEVLAAVAGYRTRLDQLTLAKNAADATPATAG